MDDVKAYRPTAAGEYSRLTIGHIFSQVADQLIIGNLDERRKLVKDLVMAELNKSGKVNENDLVNYKETENQVEKFIFTEMV